MALAFAHLRLVLTQSTCGKSNGEVIIISHRPVNSSGLKHDRLFFRESVLTNIFATGYPSIVLLNKKDP